MKKLLSCRIEEELMTKFTILAAEETIKTRNKVTVGDIIEGMITGNKKTVPSDTKRFDELMTENTALKEQLASRPYKEDDPSLVQSAIVVATKNCKEEVEKLTIDRDKWRASAEQLRAKLAPGLKNAAELPVPTLQRDNSKNYLK
jgi:hypothetical protein